LIANELDFEDGLGVQLTDHLLDRVEVYKTDTKNEININVYFKVIDEAMPFKLERHRGLDTSVRYAQHI
ncbi:MAG: recombinase family protein, partial [Hydrogenoanaerobacterium sp.]